jgi:hypothetical protein
MTRAEYVSSRTGQRWHMQSHVFPDGAVIAKCGRVITVFRRVPVEEVVVSICQDCLRRARVSVSKKGEHDGPA